MNSHKISYNERTECTKIKFENLFKNLKSKYILQSIFNNLQEKKKLEIIKYNKTIQGKININIYNYKKYSEIYTSIEIEIKPVDNKYGKFINIDKEEEKKYFHIYFNDNPEEIKRNFLNQKEKVTKIKIIIDYQIKSFCQLFYLCECIESIYFKKF